MSGEFVDLELQLKEENEIVNQSFGCWCYYGWFICIFIFIILLAIISFSLDLFYLDNSINSEIWIKPVVIGGGIIFINFGCAFVGIGIILYKRYKNVHFGDIFSTNEIVLLILLLSGIIFCVPLYVHLFHFTIFRWLGAACNLNVKVTSKRAKYLIITIKVMAIVYLFVVLGGVAIWFGYSIIAVIFRNFGGTQ